MDFGRLLYEELGHVDFKLPPVRTLLSSPSACKLALGAPVWASDAFRGTIYPVDVKKKDYLAHYASQFDAIEVNSTFYAMPPVARVHDWVSEVRPVNPQFKFCPKVPKSISHEGKLDAHFDLYPFFFNVLDGFESHLGMTLLQLHESFSPMRLGELVNFIEFWPKKYKLGVEFRHAAWFRPGPLHERILEIFKAHEVSWVVTDTPGRQDVLHLNLTASHLLVRYVLTSHHPQDQLRTKMWAGQLKELMKTGLSEIYFFAHEQDDTLYMKTLRELALLTEEEFMTRIPVDHSEVVDPQLTFF